MAGDLQRRLGEELDHLAVEQARVYHPGVQDMIRIHVDPSLYSFVQNVSVFTPTADFPHEPELSAVDTSSEDLWGRKYVSTKYQWLPSYFDVDNARKVSIRSYISGLTSVKNAKLYSYIAELFGVFLPDIELVIRAATESLNDSFGAADYSLANSSLQVVTRMVDYELMPGQSHQGPWHVEGLPHENIVATAVYTLERSENLEGGGIEFLQAEPEPESSRSSHMSCDEARDMNERPLKSDIVETLQGRLIVFPNSNIHRIALVRNKHWIKRGNEGPAKRRAIIFFIVNPNVRIVSTQEVEEQQFDDMPLEVVKELQSMQVKERIAYMKATLRSNRRLATVS